ncbi:hypothetical protein HanRHA438_Chr02g0090211 [Helianthus annuus]|nr:hypothetical protein HanRHA438_Chr02g0090211 [Helianthus annuus]
MEFYTNYSLFAKYHCNKTRSGQITDGPPFHHMTGTRLSQKRCFFSQPFEGRQPILLTRQPKIEKSKLF